MVILTTGVVAIRVFGSMARGDADELSDADILVVQSSRLSEEAKESFERKIAAMIEKSPSYSWYSDRKIREMYTAGDLFAWHIHNESIKLCPHGVDFMETLMPAQYTTAARDIEGFLKIIEGVPPSLEASEGNAGYESGLLFLCARNIAMSASWYLPGGPFFGRRSPFQLASRLGLEFPLTQREHMENMQARVLGHRGLPLRSRSGSHVADMSRRLQPWGNQVLGFVQQVREMDGDRPQATVSRPC